MYLKIVRKNEAKKVKITVINTIMAPIATPGPAYAKTGFVNIVRRIKIKINPCFINLIFIKRFFGCIV